MGIRLSRCTDTAFAFGAEVTPQQVNYNGDYPSGNVAKGLNRQRTVPVKALPANRWGLYQMHGNVWEWCDDEPRNYAQTAVDGGLVLDPAGQRGSGREALRAVRGGSWFSLVRNARSAFRYGHRRGDRLVNLGFRFALRSKSPGPAEPAGPLDLALRRSLKHDETVPATTAADNSSKYAVAGIVFRKNDGQVLGSGVHGWVGPLVGGSDQGGASVDQYVGATCTLKPCERKG